MKVTRDCVLGHIHLIDVHISIFLSPPLSPQSNITNTIKTQITVSVGRILNQNNDALSGHSPLLCVHIAIFLPYLYDVENQSNKHNQSLNNVQPLHHKGQTLGYIWPYTHDMCSHHSLSSSLKSSESKVTNRSN